MFDYISFPRNTCCFKVASQHRKRTRTGLHINVKCMCYHIQNITLKFSLRVMSVCPLTPYNIYLTTDNSQSYFKLARIQKDRKSKNNVSVLNVPHTEATLVLCDVTDILNSWSASHGIAFRYEECLMQLGYFAILLGYPSKFWNGTAYIANDNHTHTHTGSRCSDRRHGGWSRFGTVQVLLGAAYLHVRIALVC